ncbi:hypothetical protein GCM10022245_74890 [Streptomyces mayteni]
MSGAVRAAGRAGPETGAGRRRPRRARGYRCLVVHPTVAPNGAPMVDLADYPAGYLVVGLRPVTPR